jgi:putative ABC transport system permease protein
MPFLNDIKVALRALSNAKGLCATVILTLALGIGANAAIFTLVRGVLLRPLVNRDENRLIYIRQSAPGLNDANANFSVPELVDLRARIKTVSEFGDFSPASFTMVGLGEPREIRGGVVGGSYFEVMGLHPVLGRLIDMRDDGPNAAGVAVLTYRFWSTVYEKDPSVIGKPIRLEGFLGARTATVIGVLEPSVPYPAETEIMSNVVTSPHHLSATMVTGRVHRMTELFGRLAPGATLEQARAELTAAHSTIMHDHPDGYPANAKFAIDAKLLRDQISSRARTILLVLLAASALVFIIACSNVANLILARSVRREGELAIRAALGASNFALRRTLLAETLRPPHGRRPRPLRLALLRPRPRPHRRLQHALGRRRTRPPRRGPSRFRPAPPFCRHLERSRPLERQSRGLRQHHPSPPPFRRHPDRRLVPPPRGSQHAGKNSPLSPIHPDRLRHRPRPRA